MMKNDLTDDELNRIIFQSHGEEHAALRQLASEVARLRREIASAKEKINWLQEGQRECG